MTKLPLPPAPTILARTAPDLLELDPSTLLWRIYKRAGRYPTEWRVMRDTGPLSGGRFDHHIPAADGSPCRQARAVLYLGDDLLTCVAEVFQADSTLDRNRDEPWVAGFMLTRVIPLLSLRGYWPLRVGASALLNADERRSLTHCWAAAIYDAYPSVCGLAYNSAMTGQPRANVLFDRARLALPTVPIFNRPLNDPALANSLAVCANAIGYEFL